jgi:hypothetical protein
MDTTIPHNPHNLTVLVGPYGAGKTNVALNMARDLRTRYDKVTLIDLDIVNPYFRSSNNRDFLLAHDIHFLGPVYGDSNLDTPSLMPGIDAAIELAGSAHAVILDVGGDPDGARALARYTESFAGRPFRDPYHMFYVVNLNRPGTQTPAENGALLREIEAVSNLEVTHILGNTHLKAESTAANIAKAAAPTKKIADTLGIPLIAITALRELAPNVTSMLKSDPATADIPVYPVDTIVGTVWEV